MTPPETNRDLLQSLLEETSRTFALAIPLLPEPLRGQVTVAYLLFRVADTFEDATRWDLGTRRRALRQLARLLRSPDAAAHAPRLARRWRARPPVDHAGYLRLLEELPAVIQARDALDRDAAAIITAHTVRTCRGMASFLRRAEPHGVLRLRSVDELRAYCYAVAGIVGEMLTELFLRQVHALAAVTPRLRARARGFGEALQLVNVLRDSAGDLLEGRALVPDGVPRQRLLELARADLREAGEYTLTLQQAGAPHGVVAFNALPVLLADATLRRVEERGPGSKISRTRVHRILARLRDDLRLERPVIRLDPVATGPA